MGDAENIFQKIIPILDEYQLTELRIQKFHKEEGIVPLELPLILRKCAHEISEILYTDK